MDTEVRIPQTLDEMVNPRQRFSPAALTAVRALARSKPWLGVWDERFQRLATCLRELCSAYETDAWQLVHVGARSGCSGGSRLVADLNRIELTGRLSVVTMLHLFAKARFGATTGADHVRAIRWSATLFKRCFPISFSRCRVAGGLLVNDARRDE